MKKWRTILTVFGIVLLLSTLTITGWAWIGFIAVLFGFYQSSQLKKGKLLGRGLLSKPRLFIVGGFLFSFIMAMIFVPPDSPKDVSQNPKVKSEQISKDKQAASEEKKATKKSDSKGTASQTPQETTNAVQTTADVSSQDVSNSTTTQNQATPTNPNLVPVTLVETVNGDTIKVNYEGKEQSVRYLLIDTPEDKKPGTCVQPYSLDAANRNKQLVNSGQLQLEFEQGKNKTDKYGRLLAYVFVNGASVEETLLKEGYARVAYIYEPPYKYLSQYQSDESLAKNQGLNIWSKAGYVTDNGFVGCADSTASTTPKQSSPSPTPSQSTPATSGSTQIFANCTELRKVYPNGVPSSSPAYQSKLDRDHDGFACETN